jgi:hypothetical protein
MSSIAQAVVDELLEAQVVEVARLAAVSERLQPDFQFSH